MRLITPELVMEKLAAGEGVRFPPAPNYNYYDQYLKPKSTKRNITGDFRDISGIGLRSLGPQPPPPPPSAREASPLGGGIGGIGLKSLGPKWKGIGSR